MPTQCICHVRLDVFLFHFPSHAISNTFSTSQSWSIHYWFTNTKSIAPCIFTQYSYSQPIPVWNFIICQKRKINKLVQMQPRYATKHSHNWKSKAYAKKPFDLPADFLCSFTQVCTIEWNFRLWISCYFFTSSISRAMVQLARECESIPFWVREYPYENIAVFCSIPYICDFSLGNSSLYEKGWKWKFAIWWVMEVNLFRWYIALFKSSSTAGRSISSNAHGNDLDLCQLTRAHSIAKQWKPLWRYSIEIIAPMVCNCCGWWLEWTAIVPWGKFVIELDNNIFGGFTSFLVFFLFCYCFMLPVRTHKYTLTHTSFGTNWVFVSTQHYRFGCQHNDRHKYTHVQRTFTDAKWIKQHNLAFVWSPPESTITKQFVFACESEFSGKIQ